MTTTTEPPSDLSNESTPATGSPSTTPASTTSDRIRLVAALVAVGAALLFLVTAVAVTQGRDDSADTPTWGGAPVDPPLDRPDFLLTDTDGQPYDFRSETGGRLTLLFFGYTNCPDICPVHMATLSAALETPGMPEPTVVFVTTDPQRDTPERLRGWLDQFDPQYVGLTGTVEEIAAAEAAAQVAPAMIEPEDGTTSDEAAGDDDPAADGEYNVAHAAQMIAYTPDDQAHVVYPFGVRREDWVNDLPLLMETWGPAA